MLRFDLACLCTIWGQYSVLNRSKAHCRDTLSVFDDGITMFRHNRQPYANLDCERFNSTKPLAVSDEFYFVVSLESAIRPAADFDGRRKVFRKERTRRIAICAQWTMEVERVAELWLIRG